MAMKKGGAVLRKFNYLKLMELSLPVSIYHTIAKIHEYKGKQELYVENYLDILEKMIVLLKYKVQSLPMLLKEFIPVIQDLRN